MKDKKPSKKSPMPKMDMKMDMPKKGRCKGKKK
jgi:hypothetical protein